MISWIRSSVLTVVTIVNCGSLLPRITHSHFDFSAEREHLSRLSARLLEADLSRYSWRRLTVSMRSSMLG